MQRGIKGFYSTVKRAYYSKWKFTGVANYFYLICIMWFRTSKAYSVRRSSAMRTFLSKQLQSYVHCILFTLKNSQVSSERFSGITVWNLWANRTWKWSEASKIFEKQLKNSESCKVNFVRTFLLHSEKSGLWPFECKSLGTTKL